MKVPILGGPDNVDLDVLRTSSVWPSCNRYIVAFSFRAEKPSASIVIPSSRTKVVLLSISRLNFSLAVKNCTTVLQVEN